MKKLILLSFLICLYGCSSGKIKHGAPVEIIKIDLSKMSGTFDMSEILEGETEIIPLETKGLETIVGKITDIKITDEHVVIADELTKKIFVFDRGTGRYISQIARVGRGRHEYLDLTAFEVISDSTVVIFDKLMRQLNYYSLYGDFISEVDVSDMWCMDLSWFDNRLFLINSNSRTDRGYYRLFEVYENGEWGKSLIPFDERIYNGEIGSWSLDRYYSNGKDEMMLYFTPLDTLYMASAGRADAKYLVDLGKRKLPEKIIELYGYDALGYSNDNGYIKGIDQALLFGDKIWINFYEEYDYRTAIYDRVEKTTHVYEDARNPDLHAFMHRMKSDDGLLISYMEPTFLKNIFAVQSAFVDNPDNEFNIRIGRVIDALDYNDNYVVFVQKIK